MDEPIYGTATEDFWSRLPEHFHRMDALNDYAMKKYVNGIASQIQPIDDTIERIDYDSVADGGEPGATSELVDPTKADVSWLPWLGQLFGTYVRGKGQESDRQNVITAAAGFTAGTPAAIEAAAKDVLVGTQFAKVYRFSNTVGIGAGTFWDLLLVTIESETLKNLYPEIQAIVAETVSWDVTASAYTPVKQIVKTTKPVYNHSAMQVALTGSTGSINVTLASNYKVTPITPTDWYQAMVTLWTDALAHTGNLHIRYYNASDSLIGTFSQAINVGSEPTQYVVGGIAPATTSYARVFVDLNSVGGAEKLYVAQLAMRHEVNNYWIPKTADPVQAVIDKGAKPAGFKLHKGQATTSWDDVLADNPTWADWEAAGSWETLEES